jgi:integrase
MAVYQPTYKDKKTGEWKKSKKWWYEFTFAGRPIREPAKTHSKTVAKEAEKQRRRELELGYNNLDDRREVRILTFATIAQAYLEDYELKHRSAIFARYAVGHLVRHLGTKMVVDFCDETVTKYQAARLKEAASPKSINEEVGFLLRLLGERGDAIRAKLRREKRLKLKVRQNVGKAYASEQKDGLLAAATADNGFLPNGKKRTRKEPGTRSPYIRLAIAIGFNCGMRDKEIRELTIGQVDLEKLVITVGRAKTDAGEGRTIPINSTLLPELLNYLRWYTERFGIAKPEWYLFPGRIGKPARGEKRPLDPTRPVTSLKTSWKNVKQQAGVKGRFHDIRHTLVTELCESGAGEQTIMDIAGHISQQMLKRYSHIRMQAKRSALEGIGRKGTQQSAAKLSEQKEALDHPPAAGVQ